MSTPSTTTLVAPAAGGSVDPSDPHMIPSLRRSVAPRNPHWLRLCPSSFRSQRPNFVVQIIPEGRLPIERSETDSIIRNVTYPPQKVNVVMSNHILATLFYEQWSEALETVVELWEMRLNGKDHAFVPKVVCNVSVPSDKVELDERLRPLFVKKIRGLLEGELVLTWSKKLSVVVNEIHEVQRLLKKPQQLRILDQFLGKRKGLEAERDLILGRIEEFKSGLKCMLGRLENNDEESEERYLFTIMDGAVDWARVYRLVMRECRRLDDGLPIYAHRRNILSTISSQQVTVLIGETGSGKSTQLIQFLADSGAFGGSIICTQPRKIAALSLAERVNEESCGCYKGVSAVCCRSHSSVQECDSKMVFTTDQCLLQHYISDKQLSKFSCIIVDEAHERSLNTDLLLAVIKDLLCQRPKLRLIIMSATADADQFANYFFSCGTLRVEGRNFPVETKYVPCESRNISSFSSVPSYVHDVLRTVSEIHRSEGDGTILAFLTSQMEVEWASENFHALSAVALPLHGKLSYEDQLKVFHTFTGKRKVIFATNIAETSLTIPGVRYVVDCGLAKESRFEPSTGMNVLKVCWISQSSAKQRAGRAGRTEPGTCYRLYTKNDFESMASHSDPEIRKVHLGVAILKILALGIKQFDEFDFIDSPTEQAMDMAIRNLIQLGAITMKGAFYVLTAEGRQMVKLGIEPRLGKIILQCIFHQLGREGLVLASVMANSSSIFCRVGSEDAKHKSDCHKVQFCHSNGDLFTLLAVYKEWDALPLDQKNTWCWNNSINAKSMRRCHDTVVELEACLQTELNVIVPNYWCWNPQKHSQHDDTLKKVILASLAENVAMYSGSDLLGYEVASTKKHVQLHPSCSLLNFGQRPPWVIYGEILSASNEFLVCVTACDFDHLSTLSPPLPFDFAKMKSAMLQKRVLSRYGSMLLKRFCGKGNSNLHILVSSVRALCEDERTGVEVNVDRNEISLYASSQNMEKVCNLVCDALEFEKRFLQNECLEKYLYIGGPNVLPSLALFGAGAEIKHLELEKRRLTVDVLHSKIDALVDKELLLFLERVSLGQICSINKFSGNGQDSEEKEWGRVTFLTPEAAQRAVENQLEFGGGLLKVVPSRNMCSGDHRAVSSYSLRAKISWPRRCSKGVAIVKCKPGEVPYVINDFSNLVVGDRLVGVEGSVKWPNSVVIFEIDKNLSEADIFRDVSAATNRQILDMYLVRANAVDSPPILACEEAIMREISPFMPRPQANYVRVQVFQPEPRDSFMRAIITFDGSFHLEAARALEHLHGKVLPGFFYWQKVECQRLFNGSVSCPATVYPVIKNQLDHLLARLQRQKGVDCNLERNQNGSYRVKISARAMKTLAELRRPLEQLMKGKVVRNDSITPAVLQILFSRDGAMLMKSTERESGTRISFERHNMVVRIFGAPEKINIAEQRFVKALLSLHESKQLEVHLRDGFFPPDMMKILVSNFGPDLHGIKQKVPEAEFSLNTKRHSISIAGPKEAKQKVEAIIHDVAQTSGEQVRREGADDDDGCPICLCKLDDDSYTLEGCSHKFCRPCLVEQCNSAIKSIDSFPMKCAKEGCGTHILLADLRSLLTSEKLDELFRSSVCAYVAGSGGKYRFCPSPDCPSVYRVAEPEGPGAPFVCGACSVETCTKCHMEYHAYLSCEKYREFKDDPDVSLKEWRVGKEHVKNCPACGFTVEKVDGCNHVECRCGRHVCWVCLDYFWTSDDCYGHLRDVHTAIV